MKPQQCPVCNGVMYKDMSSDGVFLRCSTSDCNTKIIYIPEPDPKKERSPKERV